MNTPKRTILFFLLAVSILILGCGLGGGTRAAPTPTPIPGWEKFSGGGAELWMPERFEGGDLASDLDLIVGRLRSLGSGYEQMADMIEKNPSAFVLMILDTEIGSSGFLTNVNVVKEKVLSTMTLDTYMDLSENQLTPLGFEILAREIVQLDAYQAGKLVIQSDTLKAKEMMYIIKEKNIMWVITYATGNSEYNSQQATFEKSANTIRIP
jgi:hypothetical protein